MNTTFTDAMNNSALGGFVTAVGESYKSRRHPDAVLRSGNHWFHRVGDLFVFLALDRFWAAHAGPVLPHRCCPSGLRDRMTSRGGVETSVVNAATYPEWWALAETEHGPVTICLALGGDRSCPTGPVMDSIMRAAMANDCWPDHPSYVQPDGGWPHDPTIREGHQQISIP